MNIGLLVGVDQNGKRRDKNQLFKFKLGVIGVEPLDPFQSQRVPGSLASTVGRSSFPAVLKSEQNTCACVLRPFVPKEEVTTAVYMARCKTHKTPLDRTTPPAAAAGDGTEGHHQSITHARG